MSSPEALAATVLQNVGWNGSLPINPKAIAECYGIAVKNEVSLMGGTNSGRCFKLGDGKVMIIVNPADSKARQNFTIAHELGHAFLHGCGTHDRSTDRVEVYKQKEAQANAFAAALLMPESPVRNAVELGKNLPELAELFQVSQTAMYVRLNHLGILS